MTAISESFKQAVKEYKYSSPNLSLFERLFLNEFWTQIAEYYPFWLAANLITLVGGCCAFSSYIILWMQSEKALGEAPNYLYAVAALLFFLYQTLDGSDGKQARRTGAGSALGEMMDHGVDAVMTGFLAMIVVDATGFGLDSWIAWVCVFGGQGAFFLSNLTLLHQGRQTFFTIDIMELQWVMISSLIITSIFGSSIWSTLIHIPNIHPQLDRTVVMISELLDLQAKTSPGEGIYFQPRLIIAVGGAGGTIMNFLAYIVMAMSPYFTSYENRPNHVKRGVPGTGLGALFHQVFVILLYAFMGLMCKYRILTNSNLTDSERVICYRALIFASCFAFGDIMDRFLIMRVAHEPAPLIPPAVALMFVFSVLIRHDAEVVSHIWAVPLVSVVVHLTYFVYSGAKLASVLEIHPFKVKDWKRKQTEAIAKLKKQ